MNLAAAMIAVSLLGIQQDVLTSTSGKAEEYVIRLTPADVETIREGNRSLKSDIARTSRGGKLYRIYMDEQPNQRAVDEPNPQNIDVSLKPSSVTNEGVFSIVLSEQQLQALEDGVVFGGALPTNSRSAGVRFEIQSLAPAGIAPEDERISGRDLAAARQPNEIRNPGFREDLERSRPIPRNQDPGAYDDASVDMAYVDNMRRRAEQYKTLGDSLPDLPPTAILDQIRRSSALRSVSSDPGRVDIPTRANERLGPGSFPDEYESQTESPPFSERKSKFQVNSRASIDRSSEQAPRPSNEQVDLPRSVLDAPKPQATSDTGSGLALAILLGLLSLGANFFLGWQVFGWYMRYRDVIDQVRMGNNWSNDTRTSTI